MQDSSNNPSFVHLRCHSEYSIVDGIVRIDDYVAAAKQDAMPALALSDLSNLFGAIKFYKATRETGIKPLIGCDIWLENSKNRDQAHRALLLVQSHAGLLVAVPITQPRLPRKSISRPCRIKA